MSRSRLAALLAATALAVAGAAAMRGRGRFPPPRRPAGAKTSARTRLLLAGARLLQNRAVLRGFDVYLVGFHPMKDDPARQWEAHHLCRQVNEDFAECLLFDGDGADANLVGIEFIISERLFRALPPEERAYWHPHNGEILSGQLVAPGLPERAERAMLRDKMNSYGKTWHLWDTTADALPLGAPRLAWSFSRHGELDPARLRRRDRRLGIDSSERAETRRGLRALAHAQEGVDALAGRYPRPTTPIAGVRDAAALPPR